MKPSDLNGNWRPEVRLEPILPKDEAQRYYLAQLARQGESPLLSDRTILDELLGVEDPDLEEEKKAQQWADKLPVMRLYAAFLSAVADGRYDKARNIVAELERLLGAMGGAQGGGAMELPSNLERMAGQTPGVGLPPGETGLPSSVMPPEQLGGLPPGAGNAMMGAEGEF